VAIGLSGYATGAGATRRCGAAASCLSVCMAKSRERGGPARWHGSARHLSDAASQLCGPPRGARRRYAYRPGPLRPQACQNDSGVDTRAAAWRPRGAQPSRWAVRRHGGLGRHVFLFDTTPLQVLYTSLCSLRTLQRQRRSRRGTGAREAGRYAPPPPTQWQGRAA
jgi:hypothetical protein